MGKAKSVDILDSALEFIRQSCDNYDDKNLNQQRRLKHSTINLTTGIELLLKSRLCDEHWALVLLNPDRYHEGDWESGRFTSVGIEEAFNRLEQIAKAPVTSEIRNAIIELGKLRNQYVHFVCRSKPEYVTAVQLKAWHHILDLFGRKYWKLSYEQSKEVEYAREKMLQHEEFLDTRYKQTLPEIEDLKKAGTVVLACPFCGKNALRVGDDTKCLVCGDDYTNAAAYAEAFATNRGINDPKEYMDQQEIAYCSECGEKACIPVPDELEKLAVKAIIREKGIAYEPGMDLEPYCCLSCGSYFEKADIEECDTCGTLFVNLTEETICPECSERWKEE